MIKSRRMRWAGHVAHTEVMKNCKILVGKPERNRPLGRPRCRWKNIIKMNIMDMGFGGMD
jgi:hypothetical protein